MGIFSFLFGKKHEYKFPDDIKSKCYGEMNAAKNCINGCGTRLSEKHKLVKVVKKDGEKKFGNQGWGWRAEEWDGIWVLGLTHKQGSTYRIEIGCNPSTKGDICFDALRHEFGHFWLMSNYSAYGHDSKYKGCFMNWHDPRDIGTNEIKSMIIMGKGEGTIKIVHYIDGNMDITKK